MTIDIARIEADTKTTARVVESIVLRGDISGLNAADRARYYLQMCESLGLSAASQPFAVLRLNGKDVMYPTRGATDQLAAIHRLNRKIIDGPRVIDVAGTKMVYAVCEATHPNGRSETAVATVPVSDPLNALMKAETKAKRRATLSILGLGMLDEAELDTIPAHVKSEGKAPTAAEIESAKVDGELLRAFERDANAIEMPGEAALLWIRDRDKLNEAGFETREAAWKLLCARVASMGGASNAKVWLKRAIAEEYARRVASPEEVAVVEAQAEAKYQGGAPAPQAPPAEGRDPRTTPQFLALVDALGKADNTEAVVAAWVAFGGDVLAQAGSDVLAEGRRECFAAWKALGGVDDREALTTAITAARTAAEKPADEKPRSRSRKAAANGAPLDRSIIEYIAPIHWRERIERDNDAGHIAGGYHKRAEQWRTVGVLAHVRAMTVDRLCALLALDESSASKWLDGCAPGRRQERRDARTERRSAP